MHLVIIGPQHYELSELTRHVAKTLKRRHLNLLKEIEFQEKKPARRIPPMALRKREKYIIRRFSHNDNLVIQALERTFLSQENLNKIKKVSCFILLTVTEETYAKEFTQSENSQAIIEAFMKRQERLQALFPNQISIDQDLPLLEKHQIKKVSKEILDLAGQKAAEFQKPIAENE